MSGVKRELISLVVGLLFGGLTWLILHFLELDVDRWLVTLVVAGIAGIITSIAIKKRKKSD
jgi:hypothetical protein